MMMKMLMKMLLLLLLLCCSPTPGVDARAIPLSSCAIDVHTLELRKYYTDIRPAVLTGDNEIGVKILDRTLITEIGDGQMCCFVHLLMRFYVERVFKSYISTEPLQQRCTSALANAFLGIKNTIHSCHCQCEENTHRKIDGIHAEYIKLQMNVAPKKAIGELNVVLDWLDGLDQKV